MDQRSKPTSHKNPYSDTLQHGEFRSYRGSRLIKLVLWIFINFNDLQDRRGIILHFPQARLLHQLQQYQVTVRLEKERNKVKLTPLQCLCQVQMLMIER